MVLYSITLLPLVEETRSADLALLAPLSADNIVFYGLARSSVHLLTLLLEQGPAREYFPEK